MAKTIKKIKIRKMKINLVILGTLITLMQGVCYGQKEVIKTGVDFSESKNVISFNYGDLLSSRLSISYERLFFSGKMGIKLPLSVTYLLENDRHSNFGSPTMQGGLDVNYYPLGQTKLAFYTGFSGKTGFVYSNNYNYCPTCYYNDHLISYVYIKKSAFVSGYVNNGVLLHFNKNFSISGQFGIGVKSLINDYKAVQLSPSVIGELNGSFRF